MPLLSFVIPAHNVGEFLEECLSSILRTAGDVLEVIVVDDGSADGTLDIARAAAAGDPRVRVIHHQTALGAGAARNAGLDVAAGEFVWFVDADDYILDEGTERVIARLDDTIDVVYIEYARIMPDGATTPSPSAELLGGAPEQPFTAAEWPHIVHAHLMPWIKIVRRNLMNEQSIRFPHADYEDVVFTYEVLLAATAIVVEPALCYGYRIARPGAFTRSSGARHLVWADQWRTVLQRAEAAPAAVRDAIFDRMVRNGWYLLTCEPPRMSGATRAEFFGLFASLYRSFRPSGPRPKGEPMSLALSTGSWTLGRLQLGSRPLTRRLTGMLQRRR